MLLLPCAAPRNFLAGRGWRELCLLLGNAPGELRRQLPMALPSCPIAPSPLSPLQDAPDEPQGNEHSCSAGSQGCLPGTGCVSGGTGDADPNPLWKAQLRPSSVTSTSRGIEGMLTRLMCDRTVSLQHGFQVPITTSQSLLPQNSSALVCPCACSPTPCCWAVTSSP